MSCDHRAGSPPWAGIQSHHWRALGVEQQAVADDQRRDLQQVGRARGRGDGRQDPPAGAVHGDRRERDALDARARRAGTPRRCGRRRSSGSGTLTQRPSASTLRATARWGLSSPLDASRAANGGRGTRTRTRRTRTSRPSSTRSRRTARLPTSSRRRSPTRTTSASRPSNPDRSAPAGSATSSCSTDSTVTAGGTAEASVTSCETTGWPPAASATSVSRSPPLFSTASANGVRQSTATSTVVDDGVCSTTRTTGRWGTGSSKRTGCCAATGPSAHRAATT